MAHLTIKLPIIEETAKKRKAQLEKRKSELVTLGPNTLKVSDVDLADLLSNPSAKRVKVPKGKKRHKAFEAGHFVTLKERDISSSKIASIEFHMVSNIQLKIEKGKSFKYFIGGM